MIFLAMLEELRKWIRAVPFQPFQIELSSGRVLKVPHPDHILVTSGGMVGVEDDVGLLDVVAALMLPAFALIGRLLPEAGGAYLSTDS